MQLSRSLSAHLIWRSLGLISNLIITILLSRLLAAADSGKFFYFLSWLSLIILIGSLGIEPAITYFIASRKMSKKELLPLAFFWIFFVLLLLVISGVISYHYFPQPTEMIRSGFFFISGQLMISFFTAFFYGEHEFILPARIIFFSNLAYIIILSLFVLLCPHSISYNLILESYVILILLQGIWMLISIINNTGFRFGDIKLDVQILKTLFRYSLLVYFANITFFLATRIDYWILNHFKQDPALVGNYIQVSRIAQLFQLYPSMLAAFLFPAIAAVKAQMNTYIIRLMRIVFWLNLILVLLILFGGNFFFPLMFGKTFDQMYMLFLYMVPGIISLSLLAILSTFFSGNNQVIVNLFISLLGLIIIFLGNWFFVPIYGVITAPIVSSVGYYFCYLITWKLFSLKTRIDAIGLFAFKNRLHDFFN